MCWIIQTCLSLAKFDVFRPTRSFNTEAAFCRVKAFSQAVSHTVHTTTSQGESLLILAWVGRAAQQDLAVGNPLESSATLSKVMSNQ